MAHNGGGPLYAHNEDDIDEDLWRSPSKKDNSSNASKGEQSGSSATGPQVHTGKTKYDDGESKEATLRNELQSVRKVNEAIEGVIDSLNKAQSSMKVSLLVLCPLMRTKTVVVVGQPNGQLSFHSPQYVDADFVTDRTQPTANSEPCVARSQPGSC
jgi:hypothetical protein